MRYGKICWGNSPNSKEICLHYKIKLSETQLVSNLEIHVDIYLRDRRSYFFNVKTQVSFTKSNLNNEELLQTNSAVHSVNTRNEHLLHRPNANFSCFQKSAYHVRINIFNNLFLINHCMVHFQPALKN